MPDERSKLVYSTEQAVPRRQKPVTHALQTGVRQVQRKVTVRLDRKGRGGKSVTVIEGLQMPRKEQEALVKQWKARFGSGGTVRDTGFEIQGDHREALMAELERMGYKPKRSGG